MNNIVIRSEDVKSLKIIHEPTGQPVRFVGDYYFTLAMNNEGELKITIKTTDDE